MSSVINETIDSNKKNGTPNIRWWNKKTNRWVYDTYLTHSDIQLMLLLLENFSDIEEWAEMFTNDGWTSEIDNQHLTALWAKLSTLEEFIDSSTTIEYNRIASLTPSPTSLVGGQLLNEEGEVIDLIDANDDGGV